MTNNDDINDLSPADQGRERIDWALTEMPVLRTTQDRFAEQRHLTGVRISGCLHITTATANLARTLKAGGAELGLNIDRSSTEQQAYLSSWTEGT
jgi:adenosylhomocysteinase